MQHHRSVVAENRPITASGLIVLVAATSSAFSGEAAAPPEPGFTFQDGGVVRGPRTRKAIAFVFTGHEFADGGETILNELAQHQAKASFSLTGDFLENTNFASLIRRIVSEGH